VPKALASIGKNYVLAMSQPEVEVVKESQGQKRPAGIDLQKYRGPKEDSVWWSDRASLVREG
jgi:hypothetical protein